MNSRIFRYQIYCLCCPLWIGKLSVARVGDLVNLFSKKSNRKFKLINYKIGYSERKEYLICILTPRIPRSKYCNLWFASQMIRFQILVWAVAVACKFHSDINIALNSKPHDMWRRPSSWDQRGRMTRSESRTQRNILCIVSQPVVREDRTGGPVRSLS